MLAQQVLLLDGRGPAAAYAGLQVTTQNGEVCECAVVTAGASGLSWPPDLASRHFEDWYEDCDSLTVQQKPS